MTPQPTLPFPADDHDHHDDLNNLGLQADLNMLGRSALDRRRVLTLGLAGIGLLMVGCGAASTAVTTPVDTTPDAGGCPAAVPSETAGPYPADGSVASGQSLNALSRSGMRRTNLLTSTTTGQVAAGVPLSLTLQLVNVNASCAALSGYAVYVWHCTADGNYSMYSAGITGEDYLRGVAETDSAGRVTFQTILPGCYAGRWPHIHFEVYPTLASATSASNKIQTSQLAIPQATAQETYATAGYGSSAGNLTRITLSSDNVFSDGYSTQMPVMTGSAAAGYAATLTVGLAR